MGKTKNRSHSELEHLRGEIKELRKENRQLHKLLKTLQKHEHMFEKTEETKDEPEVKLIQCSECFKGSFTEINILDKVFGTCNVCGHRKRLK